MNPSPESDTSSKAVLDGISIGVLSSWGNPRGRDRVTARIAEHLVSAGALIHARCEGKRGPEPLPAIQSTEPDRPDSVESFRDWLRRRKIRALIFNEYQQWAREPEPAYLEIASDLGIPTFGFLVWERVFARDLPLLRRYSAVLSAHDAFRAELESKGIDTVPFSWGWQPSHPKPPLPADEPIPLLHVSGTGGAFRRKATDRVAEAFRQVAGDDAFTCRITTQTPFDPRFAATLRESGVALDEGNLPPPRVHALNRAARVSVLPSRWEGFGLTILESLAAGTPVITSDAPPMNEWVRHKKTGLLVKGDVGQQEEIAVPTQECSVEALVEVILSLQERDLLAHLERKVAGGESFLRSPEEAERELVNGLVPYLES